MTKTATIESLRAEVAELKESQERQQRIAHNCIRDANFLLAVTKAVFNVAGAAEQLLDVGMPRGASYLLAALQTIESEFDQTRIAVIAKGTSPAGGADNG